MKEVIRVENLEKSYFISNETAREIVVLKGLNFSVNQKEFVGIMGKSGCGKTTLLKSLGLIHKPTRGKLYFKNQSIEELWEDELSDIRRREIGFVFQDFYLMDSLTLQENIMLPMILDKKTEKDCFEAADYYSKHFHIDHLMDKYPYEVSGGEKQRAAICRALINQPDLLLADEPTGNLDSRSGKIVVDALEHINQDMEKAIIMVTHDPQVASHCDRILFLKDGMILEDLKKTGTREEFYNEILQRMEML